MSLIRLPASAIAGDQGFDASVISEDVTAIATCGPVIPRFSSEVIAAVFAECAVMPSAGMGGYLPVCRS